MKKKLWQKMIMVFMILLLVTSMLPLTGQALLDTGDPAAGPATGFEDQDGESTATNEVEGIELYDFENAETAADMMNIVENFANEEELNDARPLLIQLTAVDRFEQQKAIEKIIKHMESFHLLLEHQFDNEQMSEYAYETLTAHTDFIILKWELELNPDPAGFDSVVATDESDDDGIVDTLTVTIEEDVIDSSISLEDFDIDNATVTAYSTGDTENDNVIVLTITPDAGFETAPLGNLKIAAGQTIELANGEELNRRTPAAEIEDEVGPILLSAELGTVINGKTDITAIGGDSIQLEMVYPNYAGARGHGVTSNVSLWVFRDSGEGGLSISHDDTGWIFSMNIDAGGEQVTLQELLDLINSHSTVGRYVKATLTPGSDPSAAMPNGERIEGSFEQYPGSTEVILTFSEDVTMPSQGIQFLTYAGSAFTTNGTYESNGTSTITYNLNVSSQAITNATSAYAKDAIVDAAGNKADPSNVIKVTPQ